MYDRRQKLIEKALNRIDRITAFLTIVFVICMFNFILALILISKVYA